MQGITLRVLRKLKRILSGEQSKAPSFSTSSHAPLPAPVTPAKRSYLPDWNKLVSEFEIAANGNGKEAPTRVLIATAVGGHPVVTAIESLVAMALHARGADVGILLCDGALPACMQATIGDWKDNPNEFAEFGPAKRMCQGCKNAGDKVFSATHLKVYRLGEHVTDEERREAGRIAAETPFEAIPSYKFEGIPAGEHALAGALRFFSRGTLEGEELAEPVLRRYLEAALLSSYASARIIKENEIERVFMNHGIYIPHGVLAATARNLGARVSTWSLAYRKQCVIASHDDTYHHTIMNEPVSEWENMEWNDRLEGDIMAYLKSRWSGSQDWIWFHEHPEADPTKISSELGIDFTKPTIGLLTNVVWDAQLHYPANAFKNMLDWLNKTIAYFETRKDLQLVIRVHPAEIRGTVPSRQRAVDEIRKAFPRLPENVFVIPPESSASTYAVMLQCDAGIIYGTKTGLELTSMGIPVIVGGEAWIRNKGLTMDATSEEEYFRLLDRLPLAERRLDKETTRRARMYAYHFFFRRMIPLGMTSPAEGWPPLDVKAASLAELLPGNDKGLDVILDGILFGSPFVYPAERMAAELSAAG